ncbi:MAG: hypothetical protein E5V33_17245, partial [Mesorhizobium sp.]
VGGAVVGGAAGGAAGGIVGALTESGVPERDAHVYAEGVRRGGSLVTAKVDDRLTGEAERILRGERAANLDERRSAYEASGWTGFDATAEPYDDIEAERDRVRRTTPL